MKFEEALNYFKAGRSIACGRQENEGKTTFRKMCNKKVGDYYATFEDILANDWEVLKENP
jgi:hypothetical protein